MTIPRVPEADIKSLDISDVRSVIREIRRGAHEGIPPEVGEKLDRCLVALAYAERDKAEYLRRVDDVKARHRERADRLAAEVAELKERLAQAGTEAALDALAAAGTRVWDADTLDHYLAEVADKSAGSFARDHFSPEGIMAGRLLDMVAVARAALGMRRTPTAREVVDRWVQPANAAARAALGSGGDPDAAYREAIAALVEGTPILDEALADAHLLTNHTKEETPNA